MSGFILNMRESGLKEMPSRRGMNRWGRSDFASTSWRPKTYVGLGSFIKVWYGWVGLMMITPGLDSMHSVRRLHSCWLGCFLRRIY